MVANPEDLIHGREGSGVGDTMTATKAVEYRLPQGLRRPATKGLQDISTKKGN
jgi:pilus assembly protein CpaD